MPLGIYLDTPQGRKPVVLPTHFNLRDFRILIEQKFGNADHYDYSLGDVIFRTWNEESFNRQRSAIRDGVTVIVRSPPVISDQSSEDGPEWRRAQPGLCLEGVCLNTKCSAFESKVIINRGMGQSSIVNNSNVIIVKCSLCGTDIQPVLCAFNQCSWRVIGVKGDSSNSSSSSITTEWQNATNDYHRWKDHLTSWIQLTCETRK